MISEDFDKIHSSGRNVYMVDTDYKIKVVPDYKALKNFTVFGGKNVEPAELFKYLLFVESSKIENMQKMIDSVMDIKKAYDDKIREQLNHVLYLSQQ